MCLNQKTNRIENQFNKRAKQKLRPFSALKNTLKPTLFAGFVELVHQLVHVYAMVGGGFGGVLGMFLGVPIFACLQVLVRWLVNTRLQKKHMPLEASAYVNRDRQASETPPDPPESENK